MANEAVDTTEEAGNEPEPRAVSADLFQNLLVNLSLDTAIKQVLDKVEARNRLDTRASLEELTDAEEDICIAARGAFTSYLEAMGWLGFADPKATNDLATALDTAKQALKLDDTPFLGAVSHRVEALRKYVAEHPPQS